MHRGCRLSQFVVKKRLMEAQSLQKNPTTIPVVAVALVDANGCVLMQRRPLGKAHAGLWEFPGGKVEPGETAVTALVREIAEELGVALAPADLSWLATARLPGEPHEITLYLCRRWQGEPQCLDAAELGWFAPDSLDSLPLPPLDVPLAKALKRAI